MRTLAKLCSGLFAAAALVLAFPARRAATQAPSDSSEAGAASLPATTLQARLLPNDVANVGAFGVEVALSADGNTGVVGAASDGRTVFGGGAAYIFTRGAGGAWTQQARLEASDVAFADRFGNSVALSADGNTAIVGASTDDNNSVGENTGSAYVFTRSGGAWTQQRLQAGDAAQLDVFGLSVSLSADGNTALVAARLTDAPGMRDAGAGYVFTRSGAAWAQQQGRRPARRRGASGAHQRTDGEQHNRRPRLRAAQGGRGHDARRGRA